MSDTSRNQTPRPACTTTGIATKALGKLRFVRSSILVVTLFALPLLAIFWDSIPEIRRQAARVLRLTDSSDALFNAGDPTVSQRPLVAAQESLSGGENKANPSNSEEFSIASAGRESDWIEAPTQGQFGEQWLEEPPYKIDHISIETEDESISNPVASGGFCVLDEQGELVCHEGDPEVEPGHFTVTESRLPGRLTSSPVPYSETAEAIPDAWQAELQRLGAIECRLQRWGDQRQFWRFSCQIVCDSGTHTYCDAVAESPEKAIAAAFPTARRSGTKQ
ncbi:MAG: hypothetical protein Q4G68_15080 [Planctomycetia bacterium]|nr:hypothetical protein [Planctomycetia bacterium]